MNTARLCHKLIFLVAAFLTTVDSSAVPLAALHYRIIDLGTLPGGRYSSATRINNSGQVAGVADDGTGTRFFIYSNGGMHGRDLPDVTPSEVLKLNDAGQMLGYGFYTRQAIFEGFSTADTTVLAERRSIDDIRRITGNGLAFARSINNHGHIVGSVLEYADGQTVRQSSFIFSNGVFTVFHPVVSNAASETFSVTDINDSNIAIGWGYVFSGTQVVTHTFILSNGITTDLGALPGGESTWGQRINNPGHVLGTASTGTRQDHSFLYRSGRMSDLGAVRLSDFNNHDEAVGVSLRGAVIYANGRFTLLIQLVPALQAFEDFEINSINDSREMVGSGTRHRQTHAILLSPF